jgi:hypothetical protein
VQVNVSTRVELAESDMRLISSLGDAAAIAVDELDDAARAASLMP